MKSATLYNLSDYIETANAGRGFSKRSHFPSDNTLMQIALTSMGSDNRMHVEGKRPLGLGLLGRSGTADTFGLRLKSGWVMWLLRPSTT